MQGINIICVGSLKEKYLKDGAFEYLKRLTLYCKPAVIEITEAKLMDEGPMAVEAALLKEGRDILKHLSGGYNIALCIEGESISSQDLASIIDEAALTGKSRINFVIGGSWGLHNEVKAACEKRLSISKMTFPHQLCRVILLEQIYRAFTINSGAKYHK